MESGGRRATKGRSAGYGGPEDDGFNYLMTLQTFGE
jgi:hypothetical protein